MGAMNTLVSACHDYVVSNQAKNSLNGVCTSEAPADLQSKAELNLASTLSELIKNCNGKITITIEAGGTNDNGASSSEKSITINTSANITRQMIP